MKKQKRYLNKFVRYFLDFEEHRGMQIAITTLAQELRMPEKKLDSQFISSARRPLGRAGLILKAYPDSPHPTQCILVAWINGQLNRDAVESEVRRHYRAIQQAQSRTDRDVKICQNLFGYNPLQLEEKKEEQYASNSSDSE